MNKQSAMNFSYVAFDEVSQAAISYGPSASRALLLADEVAPEAPIYVLDAGVLGWKIWHFRLDLDAARKEIENLPLITELLTLLPSASHWMH